MKIVNRAVSELIGYVNNSRTHSDAQVSQIAASIKEFGFTNPVLTDGENGIVAGHGRVQAAKKLGMKEVPTISLEHLTPTQRKAYIIADNKLALNAGWDEALLAVEMEGLMDDGFHLDILGFDADEISKLFGIVPSEGLTDPDDVPEPPVNPIAVEGDVWLLGNHRLACGSSTDEHTVAKVLNGVKPHLMVTDPPYGVDYDPSWRNGLDAVRRSQGKVSNDGIADWREAWVLFPGDVAYVWSAPGPLQVASYQSLVESGFDPRYQIIWKKPHFVLGRGDYHWQHEPCWYAVRKGSKTYWNGDRKQTSVWEITNGTFQGGKAKAEDAKTGHGTQKPVECMKRPIENNSSPGQAVYEPFSGSGTTIIAGEITGRSVHAIELNPAYVDTAIKRWEQYTGQEATLEGDGRTFNEMCEVRYAGGDWAKNTAGSYDDAVAAAHVKTRGKDAAD